MCTNNPCLTRFTNPVAHPCGADSVFAGPTFPLNILPQPRLQPVYHPPVHQHPAPIVPRLGFMGHVAYGYGMVVDSVSCGGIAERLGLERGDVIVRINNHPIHDDDCYQNALLNAVRFQNGFIDLTVVNVRSGRMVHRTGNISFGGNGPILPRSTPHIHTSMRIGF